jgi:Integrase
LALETDLDLSKIALPKQTVSNTQTLTPEQIGQLIKIIEGNEVELSILLAVWLGLRRSEIAALEKSDFDSKNKTVSINKALVQNERNEWVIKGTKNSTSTRLLSCPDYIMSRIDNLEDGRILSLHPNTLYRNLQKECERNGLPKIRFHDLRHCAASIMLLLGIPDKYAMERGGWASKQTMTGRYQHTIDTAAQTFSNSIDDYYYSLLTALPDDSIANKIANE